MIFFYPILMLYIHSITRSQASKECDQVIEIVRSFFHCLRGGEFPRSVDHPLWIDFRIAFFQGRLRERCLSGLTELILTYRRFVNEADALKSLMIFRSLMLGVLVIVCFPQGALLLLPEPSLVCTLLCQQGFLWLGLWMVVRVTPPGEVATYCRTTLVENSRFIEIGRDTLFRKTHYLKRVTDFWTIVELGQGGIGVVGVLSPDILGI